MRGHGSQWISHKINIGHTGQLKKLKSWEPFWSYQLNSTANLANFEVNGLDWLVAPRIFIFSIVLEAEYISHVKYIETHASKFLTLNILSIGTVQSI